ncbi:YpoC family protein [Sutcliffiella rhizosphaerae]|uniref:YpoC-like domain-containing protein n=1 Tax=Sutcliffiella rhizosphaerae TaxID=2880967 RepID=A0ABM8YRP0_9BACI|nr:hypothetical protein [Sutcliffiella rhizosphaerae]CAG9622616.1 hypothetical protein BACCIP111883_03407 [Sutcliffiella rhizosphaerae]
MKVPDGFLHPYFYSKGDLLESHAFSLQDLLEFPFKYDIAYYLGAAPDRLPWENNNESIPFLLLIWKTNENTLNFLHEKRDRTKTKATMISSIAIYLQLLFWMNEQPVRSINDWTRDSNLFKWKPVNIEERLDFVIKRPELYHSFIQLQQLYSESTKLFYKKKALDMKINSSK